MIVVDKRKRTMVNVGKTYAISIPSLWGALLVFHAIHPKKKMHSNSTRSSNLVWQRKRWHQVIFGWKHKARRDI